jgi:hypothetical protein
MAGAAAAAAAGEADTTSWILSSVSDRGGDVDGLGGTPKTGWGVVSRQRGTEGEQSSRHKGTGSGRAIPQQQGRLQRELRTTLIREVVAHAELRAALLLLELVTRGLPRDCNSSNDEDRGEGRDEQSADER